MKNSPLIYSLPEIAIWAEEKKVSLPNVQRGFVWHPSQIENLWDSLLRGYPVGAFVLSPQKEGTFEMLDGQQRATAICLGFGSKTFRDSQDRYKLYIDLDIPGDNDNRKFIFRVITRSHPWGYERRDNTKTLSMAEKRKAMDLYAREDYLDPALDQYFPYDSAISVPFHFFLESAQQNLRDDQLISDIKQWPLWQKVTDAWFSWREEYAARDGFDLSNTLTNITQVEKRIREIYDEVKQMLDPDSGQKIPALYLDFDHYKNKWQTTTNRKIANSKKAQVNATEVNDEADTVDEIENLFIRLNAGGTTLTGEELNYSILKGHIKPELQKSIEKNCDGFIRPARFITIAYRLYQHKYSEEQRDGLNMRIKPKQFQKALSEKQQKAGFEDFIASVLDDKIYGGQTLLEHAKTLLEYEESKNNYGLPHLLSAKIAHTAPEVMFMFLYRLMIKKDQFKMNSDMHRKALGMITLFMWLGKGESQRDHAKLLANIWPSVKSIKMESFWSALTVQRALLRDVLVPFPSYSKKRDSLKKFSTYNPQVKMDVFSKFDKDTGFGLFAEKMFFNRDLVLYAQREFLSKYFDQKEYYLDDTNMPFDWDHISPAKFINSKKNIPRVIKEWYNTIGNLRAWPFSLNRMDQDVVPSQKFNPLNPAFYENPEKKGFKEVQDSWDRFISINSKLIQSRSDLPRLLPVWSLCSSNKKWADCKIDDLKKDWKPVYELIRDRTLSICEEWYTKLKIEELIPASHQDLFEVFRTILHQNKWIDNPWHDAELKKEFKDDVFKSWISKNPVKLSKGSIYLYVYISRDTEEILNEDGIRFGIYEKSPNNFIKSLKISDKDSDNYDSDNKSWIQGYFTLTSFDEDSYLQLIKEFRDWLNQFPNKEIRQLTNVFLDSISQKYRSRLGK